MSSYYVPHPTRVGYDIYENYKAQSQLQFNYVGIIYRASLVSFIHALPKICDALKCMFKIL